MLCKPRFPLYIWYIDIELEENQILIPTSHLQLRLGRIRCLDPKIGPWMMDADLFPTNLGLGRHNRLLQSQGYQPASIMMLETSIDRPHFNILTLFQG